MRYDILYFSFLSHLPQKNLTLELISRSRIINLYLRSCLISNRVARNRSIEAESIIIQLEKK